MPSRSMREGRARRTALAAACAIGLASLTAGSGGATLAAFTDYAVADVVAGAGVWTPDPPAACGPVEAYAGVVWGTPGDDELVGDDRPRIYLGLGGDDVLTSSIAADCLVGGEGRDVLVGNAATILVGDPSDLHVWQPDGPPPDGGTAAVVERPPEAPASPSRTEPAPSSPPDPGTRPDGPRTPATPTTSPTVPPAAPPATTVPTPSPSSPPDDAGPSPATPAAAPVKDTAPDAAGPAPAD